MKCNRVRMIDDDEQITFCNWQFRLAVIECIACAHEALTFEIGSAPKTTNTRTHTHTLTHTHTDILRCIQVQECSHKSCYLHIECN